MLRLRIIGTVAPLNYVSSCRSKSNLIFAWNQGDTEEVT